MRAPDDHTPVLTGLGAATALGCGLEATWEALVDGRTGVKPTGDADPAGGMGLAALVKPPYLRVAVPDELQAHIKYLNGSGELAAEVAHETWSDTGWADADVDGERKGLWLSQMDAWDWSCTELRAGFVDATEGFKKPLEPEALNRSAARFTKPFYMLESIKNNAFSFVAAWYGLKGANTGVAGFAGGTLQLLDLAARAVARGSQDRALFVGTGRAASEIARRDAVLHGWRLPSKDLAYRPFDESGAGVVLGEGAAAVGIERYADAKVRSARIHGALLGFGASMGEPLEGLAAPRAGTLRDAMARALAAAEAAPGEIMAVVLPALGRPEADGAMLEAPAGITALEGVPAVSWRGALGHSGLGSGIVEVAIAAKALASRRLPGTTGCTTPLDPRVRLETAEREGRAILVVGAGLQGEACAHVIASV